MSFGFIREDIVFVRAPSWSQIASVLTGSWLSPNPFLLDYYRPLVILSCAAEFPLFRTWAPGYHLTNLLLLTGCGLGLYVRAFRLVPSARLALAVLTLWLGAMLVEDVQGVLDQHPYSAWEASESGRNYRHWAHHLPKPSARLLRLRASGRIDHGWPIYLRDPPPAY